jgi:hypothetical protein
MATKPKVLVASGTVNSVPGRVYSMGLSGGSDVASMFLRDGGAAGSTATATLKVGTDASAQFTFPGGLQFSTSIYATITGTAPTAVVEFED